MSFSISVYNPVFPKDKTKARALTEPQFDVVHDYIIGRMNDRRKINEAMIIKMLIAAGLPVNFESTK